MLIIINPIAHERLPELAALLAAADLARDRALCPRLAKQSQGPMGHATQPRPFQSARQREREREMKSARWRWNEEREREGDRASTLPHYLLSGQRACITAVLWDLLPTRAQESQQYPRKLGMALLVSASAALLGASKGRRRGELAVPRALPKASKVKAKNLCPCFYKLNCGRIADELRL